jgi:hypothetical protein
MCSSARSMRAFPARRIKSLTALLACVTLVMAAAAAADCAHAATVGSVQPGIWRHRHVSTAYFGVTTVFTCTTIEDAVRRVLLYFGARPDLKVKASCPNLIYPVRSAVVHSDFYTLEPAPPGAIDTVPAQWVGVQLMPQRPSFMDPGECELVDQIKGLLTKDFSLRDVRYHTICTPYDETLLDYDVQAQVLKPLSAGRSAGQ